MIDGTKGCVDQVDLGTSASDGMVLADDVSGRGLMQLVVTTSNRRITVLETDIPYDPRRAWRWEDPSGGGQQRAVAPSSGLTLVVQRPPSAAGSSAVREIVGSEFYVVFEILDRRMQTKQQKPIADSYQVTVYMGSRAVLAQHTYEAPGQYALQVPVPHHFKERAKIHIQVQVKDGTISRDSFWISINIGFYRSIKWILLLPFFFFFLISIFKINILKKISNKLDE